VLLAEIDFFVKDGKKKTFLVLIQNLKKEEEDS
jgi:hypothetical protein